jgi:hypothetical protein
MHRLIAVLLLLAGGGAGYLVMIDRRSVLALYFVELDGMLPVPLYGILGAAGVVVLALSLLKSLTKPEERVMAGPVRAAPKLRMVQGMQGRGASLRDRVMMAASALPLEAGATLLIDERAGVPLTLHLEQTPPGRSKRSIERVGGLLASLPTPPRIAIVYRDCPASQTPRHTEVLGALSVHMTRGSFRVTSHLDRVDVVFLQPDPEWRASW